MSIQDKSYKTTKEALVKYLQDFSLVDGDLSDLDLGDLGNAIGYIVGDFLDDDIVGFEKDDFMTGLNHGFSIKDGTHDL